MAYIGGSREREKKWESDGKRDAAQQIMAENIEDLRGPAGLKKGRGASRCTEKKRAGRILN